MDKFPLVLFLVKPRLPYKALLIFIQKLDTVGQKLLWLLAFSPSHIDENLDNQLGEILVLEPLLAV